MYLQSKWNVFGLSGYVTRSERLGNVHYTLNSRSQVISAVEMFFVAWNFIRAKKEKHDILIICLTWRLALIIYILHKVYHIPFVVYLHGSDIHLSKKTRLEKYWIKKIIRDASEVIANSAYTKNMGMEYGREDIRVIHPGIAYHEKSNAANQKGKTLLTISRLEKRKGINTTLRALKILIKKHSDLHYIVAGKGKELSALQRLARELRLNKHVTFLGHVTEEEKDWLYRQASIFVMPCYEVQEEGNVEGFGIVYLEANMYGKFVIAGRSGGAPDAVKDGETGYVVDGTDPGEIAEKIDQFFQEKEVNITYSRQCKEWAYMHRWGYIGERLLNVIEKSGRNKFV